MEKLVSVELIILVVITFMFIAILVRMKGFSKFKIGKDGIEVDRTDEYKKLLDFAEGFNKRLDKVDERLDGIDGETKGIKLRADIQYEYLRKATVAANQGLVWGGVQPPFIETVRSGLLLAMLEQNGNLIDRMKHVIISEPDGLKQWRSKVEEFVHDKENKGKITPRFWEIVKEIEQGLK